MNENKQSEDKDKYETNNNQQNRNEILCYFQAMIHDMALTRQLLFSAQQAIFEGANAPEKLKQIPII